MNPIEVEFFRAPFLEQGANISSDVEESRAKTFTADLKRLVPRLQRLRTSFVVRRLQHTEAGLELIFLLRDTMQQDLFQAVRQSQLPLGANEFEQEVKEVAQEVEMLAHRIAQAMSPGVTPSRLRNDDPAAQQWRATRELFLRRRGRHVLSGYKKPQHYSSALLFAQGNHATINARIASLLPGHARLKDVAFHGAIPAALENVRFHRTVQMIRTSFVKSEEIVMQLVRTMDAGLLVTMEVLILWDSVTGQPRSMEFRRFVTP